MTKTIDTSLFTEEQQAAFYAAFVAAGGVDDAQDGNPCPWGCPWDWQPEITVEGETIEEWAASWFEQNRAEIEALLAEESEPRQYEIRNAIRECGFGLADAIRNCYVDNLEFEAADDAEAIAFCEKLQQEHDDKAFALAEADRSLMRSYENAPLYKASLWRIDEDEDVQVEE